MNELHSSLFVLSRLLFAGVVTVISGATLLGAPIEVALLPKCDVRGNIVTLGDIAELAGSDAEGIEQLEKLPLIPAPSAGLGRRLARQEIIELLSLHGYANDELKITGANVVKISGTAENASRYWIPVSGRQKQRATEYVQRAIQKYLQERDPESRLWQAQVELDDSQVREVLQSGENIVVGRHEVAINGKISFHIASGNPVASLDASISATVAPQSGVLVAVRPISRGDLIRREDLRWDASAVANPNRPGAERLEDLVGKQATRSIAENRVVALADIRRPVLVDRGRVVEVTAKNAGVIVKAVARSQEDGALGDLVKVESLDTGEVYLTQVTGTREVAVFAAATPVSGTSTHSEAEVHLSSRMQATRRPNN